MDEILALNTVEFIKTKPNKEEATTPNTSSPIIIDSGSNSTIFRDKKYFTSYTPKLFNISISNESASLPSEGYGSAEIQLSPSFTLKIKKAQYCPKSPANLLSSNDIESNHLYFASVGGKAGKIYKETTSSPNQETDPVVTNTTKRFGLHFLIPPNRPMYSTTLLAHVNNQLRKYVDITPEERIILEQVKKRLDESTTLLHQRLGHISLPRLEHMIRCNTTADLPRTTLGKLEGPCESCAKGKQKKKPFKSAQLRSSEPGEFLHIDISEMSELSWHKEKYVLTAVCDATNFSWVSFIPSKDTALLHTIRLIEKLDLEFDISVRKIRMDRGELMSTAFDSYCVAKGIEISPSPRKTPEMNGIAERHIQTIVDMGRTLLQHCNINNKYWDIAMKHANDIKNCLPVISKGILSPFEAFHGIVPFVEQFKVFGCRALYHLEKSDRRKLEAKSAEAIYVGSQSRSLVKLWDIRTRKLIIRAVKDVVFFENEFPALPTNTTDSPDSNIKETTLLLSTPTPTTEEEEKSASENINTYLEKLKQLRNNPLAPETIRILRSKQKQHIPIFSPTPPRKPPLGPYTPSTNPRKRKDLSPDSKNMDEPEPKACIQTHCTLKIFLIFVYPYF